MCKADLDIHINRMEENAINFLYYSYFKKVNEKLSTEVKNYESGIVNFLFYSYFKKTIKQFDSEKKIIEIAIERAYQDATLQGAYNTLLPKPKDEDSEDNKEAIKLRLLSADAYYEAFTLLQGGVIELLENYKDFDNIHRKICVGNNDEVGLIGIYKDIVKGDGASPCFTPGNAQKWVNMTMKNLYVICGVLINSKCNSKIEAFCKKVLCCAKFFHIPIDSYILEAWEDIPSSESSYIKRDKSDNVRIKYQKDGKDYILSTKKRGTLTTTWSSMEDYDIYQELRDKCAKKALKNSKEKDEWPIEWESINWIAVSEKRKERKSK